MIGNEGEVIGERRECAQSSPRTLSPKDVTAIVLAGGAATRMGGCDKGLVSLEGRPLVHHVLDRLQPQCAEIVVSANRNLETYRALGYPVVSDTVTGFQGPLAGIAAALSIVKTPLAVAAPCDSPYVPMDYVKRLLSAFEADPHCRAAAAKAEGRAQPVFMMIDVQLKEGLEAYVKEGGRRVREWLEREKVVWVEFEKLSDFDNLNSAEDLERAQREHGAARD